MIRQRLKPLVHRLYIFFSISVIIFVMYVGVSFHLCSLSDRKIQTDITKFRYILNY